MVSILYWRCLHGGVQPLRHRDADSVSILYWRCDGSGASCRGGVAHGVSILYWRCADSLYTPPCHDTSIGFNSLLEMRIRGYQLIPPSLHPSFQFSIGDAVRPTRKEYSRSGNQFQFSIGDARGMGWSPAGLQRGGFNSLLEMQPPLWHSRGGLLNNPVSILYWRCGDGRCLRWCWTACFNSLLEMLWWR